MPRFVARDEKITKKKGAKKETLQGELDEGLIDSTKK